MKRVMGFEQKIVRRLRILAVFMLMGLVTPACFKDKGGKNIVVSNNTEQTQLQTSKPISASDNNASGNTKSESANKNQNSQNTASKSSAQEQANSTTRPITSITNMILNLSDLSSTQLREDSAKIFSSTGSPYKSDADKTTVVRQITTSVSICEPSKFTTDMWRKVADDISSHFKQEFGDQLTGLDAFLARANSVIVLKRSGDCKVDHGVMFNQLTQEAVDKMKEGGLPVAKEKLVYITDSTVKNIKSGGSGTVKPPVDNNGTTEETRNIIFNLSRLEDADLEDYYDALAKAKGFPYKKDSEKDVLVSKVETDIKICSLSSLKRSVQAGIANAIAQEILGGGSDSADEKNEADEDIDDTEDSNTVVVDEEEESSDEVEESDNSDNETASDIAKEYFDNTNVLIVLAVSEDCKAKSGNFVKASKRTVDALGKAFGITVNDKKVYMTTDAAYRQLTGIGKEKEVSDVVKAAKEECVKACGDEGVEDVCAKQSLGVMKNQCNMELSKSEDTVMILKTTTQMCSNGRTMTCPNVPVGPGGGNDDGGLPPGVGRNMVPRLCEIIEIECENGIPKLPVAEPATVTTKGGISDWRSKVPGGN